MDEKKKNKGNCYIHHIKASKYNLFHPLPSPFVYEPTFVMTLANPPPPIVIYDILNYPLVDNFTAPTPTPTQSLSSLITAALIIGGGAWILANIISRR